MRQNKGKELQIKGDIHHKTEFVFSLPDCAEILCTTVFLFLHFFFSIAFFLKGCTDLYYARGVQGVLLMRVGGATSQLDLPSLTPLSVAGCGRLQLGILQGALQ